MIRDKLKKARISNGYSQEEMALVLCVDRSTYTCYETGKIDIPVKCLIGAAKVFDVAFDWFTASEMYSAEVQEPQEPVLNSANMFIPDKSLSASDQNNGDSFASALSSEERIFIARYRILKEAGRNDELDELMNKMVSEEMDKI